MLVPYVLATPFIFQISCDPVASVSIRVRCHYDYTVTEIKGVKNINKIKDIYVPPCHLPSRTISSIKLASTDNQVGLAAVTRQASGQLAGVARGTRQGRHHYHQAGIPSQRLADDVGGHVKAGHSVDLPEHITNANAGRCGGAVLSNGNDTCGALAVYFQPKGMLACQAGREYRLPGRSCAGPPPAASREQ